MTKYLIGLIVTCGILLAQTNTNILGDRTIKGKLDVSTVTNTSLPVPVQASDLTGTACSTNNTWTVYQNKPLICSGGNWLAPIASNGNQPTCIASSVSGTYTFNSALCTVFDLTITGNITASTFLNGSNGTQYLVKLTQDNTGNRTFAYPPTFVGSNCPILPLANKSTFLQGYWNGTNFFVTTCAYDLSYNVNLTGSNTGLGSPPNDRVFWTFDNVTNNLNIVDGNGVKHNTVTAVSSGDGKVVLNVDANGVQQRALPSGDLVGSFPNPTVGQIHNNVVTVNHAASPYTVLATDSVIVCDATAGSVIINLPAATGTGREINIKKIDSSVNGCTPTRAGADLIDGFTATSLTNQYAAAKLVDSSSAVWSRMQVNQLNGDVTGVSVSNTVVAINGGSMPVSALAIGTNSSGQPIVSTTSAIMMGTCATTLTNLGTNWLIGLGGATTACAGSSETTRIPIGAHTVLNLHARAGSTGTLGGGIILVRKNGTGQTLTCTLSNSATCSDLTHTFTTADGDGVSVSVQSAGGTLTTGPTYSSGASACTNGTQVVTFTNNTSGPAPVNATGTITVSGNVPTGAVTLTGNGAGYTAATPPTNGTVATCTGTAVFTGGTVTVDALGSISASIEVR